MTEWTGDHCAFFSLADTFAASLKERVSPSSITEQVSDKTNIAWIDDIQEIIFSAQ